MNIDFIHDHLLVQSGGGVLIQTGGKIQSGKIVNIPQGSGASSACQSTNSCFIPSSITVNSGVTIIWKNQDSVAHTVTSGNPTAGPDGEFDSGLFGQGHTFSHTFNSPGTFDYYDQVHPWQIGKVIVS